MICASVIPTCEPAPAILRPIAVISLSVVAKLFPSATMVEPNRSKLLCGIPVMFASLASDVAASSALMFVASPSMTMVLVNPRIFSVWIPSCPAASATPAISDAEVGISFAMSRMPWLSACSSASVASTVFLTPANACSYSTPALIPAAASVPMAAALAAIAVAPIFPIFARPPIPDCAIFSVRLNEPSSCPAILIATL